MAVYKFANHNNNVIVREWCAKNRGRSSALSEMLFPHLKVPKTGISKYKCGEMCVDDELLERAKSFMEVIEKEEANGIRKVNSPLTRKLSLASSKYEKYSQIQNSEHFSHYAKFHKDYVYYNDQFEKDLGIRLPVKCAASNLVSESFKRDLIKVMNYVNKHNLKPNHTPCEVIRKSNTKSVKTASRRMALKTVGAKSVNKCKNDFFDYVELINNDERLSKLVPVILMMNFTDVKDFDQVDSLYKKFTDENGMFSVVKLKNIEKCYNKALEMIENGWLAD